MDLILVVVVLAVAILGAVMLLRRQKTDKLRSRFGSEYSRTVEEAGGPGKAEAELLKREKRVSKFTIHPLDADRRGRFIDSWRDVQADFVDDPKGAVTRADALLGDVMGARGYPVTDFEQQAADLSVDHPEVVQNYRSAHDIAVRHERGDAGTEDLRQAMIHYRGLFDELVHEAEPAQAKKGV